MTDAIRRVEHYLDEFAKMRGLDPEEIHGLHIGHEEREAILRVSDLRKLVAMAKVVEGA